MADSGVELIGLRKAFGAARAIDEVHLSIAPGEFLALLGPSGCGKTTLLRAIAGLIAPDAGAIRIGGRMIVDAQRRLFIPPERRNLGMVFQDYALWPHMRVRENVAFPLEARGAPKAQRADLVATALRRVGLTPFAERFPSELSGGQQQRVALARAIVNGPGLLLFDEPLSNLDAGLRETLGREISTLVRELGATAIYVTHDQGEALSLSDRIAVMRDGRVAQLGAPEDLYRDPADAWVAGFLKAGALIEGQAGAGAFRPDGATAPLKLPELVNGHAGPSTLLLPNSALRVQADGELQLAVATAQFRGDRYEITARWDGAESGPVIQFWHDRFLRPGEKVPVALEKSKLRLFAGGASRH